ncbi:dienelactone hydrolase [Mycolicibacterium moriokaense]|uniref:Dienelactone hydrolase n=2 Tax=Mycolicibacterium moriokaense TaxID=39691 RepID=A0AAD1HCL7_9MYCO|nr:dienelactone hydrolase [Mycolicibacterium moriokaense]
MAGCSQNGDARTEPDPVAPDSTGTVGIRQVEFVDRGTEGTERHLALNVFYPAEAAPADAEPFPMPFYTDVTVYPDLAPADNERHPLILFSHGRGSNGLMYAWFAQELASRGYIVAALNHYRANTYDSSIVYLANKLWQRPKDLTLTANFLVGDAFWGTLIDEDRIGVSGHSQGGFTSLWIGGARVNAEKYLDFQRGWKNNRAVPQHLRDQLPLDAAPALDVADPRIKAVFAMAPGIIQAFGMDKAGLHELKLPTYLIVGARDTQTPPDENAEFAAQNVPGSELNILPGDVDHEIFTNECNQIGRDEFPEACIDAPGVDRTALHREIADAASRFFDSHLRG